LNATTRRIFPYLMLLLILSALGWAVSFGTLPKADFTFNNGTEIKTVDPAKATGSPEGRIINALFEGLLRNLPEKEATDPHQVIPMEPTTGGVAESYQVSADGTVYTFQLRPSARWSNGEPMTAHDFVWSWQRMLHPETGSEYSYQLHYVVKAKKYNMAEVQVGDRVEVELKDRRDPLQAFPRGTLKRGILKAIKNPQRSSPGDDAEEADSREEWIYHVEVKPISKGKVSWDAAGTLKTFSQQPPTGSTVDHSCHHVLIDFDSNVEIRALNDQTLVIKLNNPTPYFKQLLAFYPLYPVNRECVEKYGAPNWTKPENIVTNGPYRLEFRRIRDRLRLTKNAHYWDAKNVSLETIDAMAITSYTTSLNMYINGQLDWSPTMPNTIMDLLRKRDDFVSAPFMAVYFYRINVERPPLDKKLVRRALNLAINKQLICDQITSAGQQPARSFVPPQLEGYSGQQCGAHDVARARQLLAEAGYPNGKGFPKVQILYNTSDSHQEIAEFIQQEWKENLGIDIELRNLEWATFLDTLNQGDYSVSRSGWIGDYPDPNTFLDMFVTDGDNNQTNWSNSTYDELIEAAKSEPDASRRMEILQQAEGILMSELPILPIYFYVSTNLVSPRVKGFSGNIQDVHPLHILRVE
jgi:oligopeptide transport system substrate-binding protein